MSISIPVYDEVTLDIRSGIIHITVSPLEEKIKAIRLELHAEKTRARVGEEIRFFSTVVLEKSVPQDVTYTAGIYVNGTKIGNVNMKIGRGGYVGRATFTLKFDRAGLYRVWLVGPDYVTIKRAPPPPPRPPPGRPPTPTRPKPTPPRPPTPPPPPPPGGPPRPI